MKVLFYQTSSGRAPVREFISALSQDLQAQVTNAVLVLEDGGAISLPLSKNLSGILKGLHELRLKDRTGIYRIFYFIKVKDSIYLVHAFKKKTQQIPQKEIDVVKSRIREI